MKAPPTHTNTSRNSHRRVSCIAAAVLFSLSSSVIAQTEFINEPLRSGSLPAGWSQTDVTFTTAAGGYSNMTATTSILATPVFDASGATSVVVDFSVAKFGSGVDGPITVEYSTNGGSDWTVAGDSQTPTSSTYIDDTITINASSASFAIRFTRAASPSQKRLRDVVISDPNAALALELTSLTPANGATDIPTDTVLALTFNQPVAAGSGHVILYQGINEVQSFPAIEGDYTGSTVTFTPDANLDFNTSYHVIVQATAIEDTSGNPFAGLLIDTDWTFTTTGPDITGPLPVTFIPADGATGVPLSMEEIRVLFDEPISIVGNGLIAVRRVDDNTVVDSVPADDFFSVVGGELNEMIVYLLPEVFDYGTAYYVSVPADTVVDSSGNLNLAFGEPTSDNPWVFVTEPEPTSVPLADGIPYTQDFAAFAEIAPFPASPPFPSAWFATGPDLTYDGDWGSGTTGGFRGNASIFGYQHTEDADVLVKGVRVRNDTGAEITDMTISYRGRGARLTGGRTPAYVVKIGELEVPALAYSTTEGDDVLKSASISGLSIAPDAVFEITWTSDRGLAGSGSSKQIGISDFSISNEASLLPPSMGATELVLASLSSVGFQATASATGDGGSAISERGFVIAETTVNDTPEIGGIGVTTQVDDLAEVGAFSGLFSGLTPSTSYTVRAYATNSEGTSYSGAITVVTLAPVPSFVSSYEQPFANYDGTWPAGWTAISSGGINSYVGDWSTGSTGGFRGGVSSPGVLGFQHTASTGILTVSLTLTNDTGGVLNQLNVSYLGRVARADQPRSPVWTVKIDDNVVESLAYSTDGGVDATVSHFITGLNIAEGETFTISWESDRGENVISGASKQIGLGEVMISLSEPPPPADDFGSWIGGFPGVGIETGPNDDPDGDGISNLLEHVLGLRPDVANTNSLVDVSEAGAGSVTFFHNLAKELGTDVQVGYEWSTNLATWTADGGTLNGVTVVFATPMIIDNTDTDFDVVEVVANVTAGTAEKLFVRLTASVAP